MYVPLAGERKMIQRWNIANNWRSELKATNSVPPSMLPLVRFGFDPVSGNVAIDYASDSGDCALRWIVDKGSAACTGELFDDVKDPYGWTLRVAPDDLSKAAGNGYFVEGNQFCAEIEVNSSPVRKVCPVALMGQEVAYVQTEGDDFWFLVTRNDADLTHNLFVIDARTFATVAEMRALPFGKLDNIVNLKVDEKLQNLFVFRSDDTIQIWKLRERSLVVEAQSRFIFQGAGWRTHALDLKRGLLSTYGDGVVRTYRYDVPLDEIVRSLDQVAAREHPPGK